MIDTVVYKHSWCIEKTDSRREEKTFTAADDYFAKNSRQAMLATTISHTGLYRQSCGNRQSSFRTDPSHGGSYPCLRNRRRGRDSALSPYV